MKKVIVILTIIIIILAGVLGFFGIKLKKANVKISDILSPKKEVIVVEAPEKNYGNRGNISQTEKIKFLTKNDEYVVGMIGLEKSTVEKEFSNEDMLRFALNVAVYRYSDILTTRKMQNGTEGYVIQPEMVNEITNEFFGNSNVSFDQKTYAHYSRTVKAFVFGESIVKSLYYYPVSYEAVDVKLETSEATTEVATANTTENVVAETETPKETYIYITADAIFVPDEDTESFEKAKYEGSYEEKDVDHTIKFKFDKHGKLISYQNI